MKYMGSKRAMLENGLGVILRESIKDCTRFFDLFSGSGAVAAHIAESFDVAVFSSDIQLYSSFLCGSIIGRTRPRISRPLWEKWHSDVVDFMTNHRDAFDIAKKFDEVKWERAPKKSINIARTMCAASPLPITKAYGGHYFSPSQALTLDALRATVPSTPEAHALTMAALIIASSRSVASPGHTAQPFQPTKSASPFLWSAWRRDIMDYAKNELGELCARHARIKGGVRVAKAEDVVKHLRPGDLAFVDPPYSSVQYSRFYHVLETIARGESNAVFGVGRYPTQSERPRSDFSLRTKSAEAITNLLSTISKRGATAIVTFPSNDASNGLSGKLVEEIAERFFIVEKSEIRGRFSTLGGNSILRDSRVTSKELILVLKPQ